MKTKRTVWSLSLLLFFLPVSITCDQVPIPGSGRDAANFIPMRERVKIMQKFWDWKKRERTSDDNAGTRGGYVDHQE